MDETKSTKLSHLRLAAEAAKNYSGGLVAELAEAASGAIEELDGVKADKPTFYDLSIAAEQWIDATGADAVEGFAYCAKVAVSGLTERDGTDTVLDLTSLGTAKACGMANTSVTYDGGVKYYATSKPATVINGQVRIIKAKEETV